MTTDPFAEAARAEAEKRHQGDWDPFEQEPVDDWGFAEAERRAFVSGAVWARDHLAAQEPTDAEVEAAAEAWSKSFIDGHPQREAWKPGGDISTRYAAIERARTALSAARAARRDEENRDG